MKNERFNIRPIMNGYLCEYSYYKKNEDPMESSYRDEQFMFATWNEVVKWVEANKLEVPPK